MNRIILKGIVFTMLFCICIIGWAQRKPTPINKSIVKDISKISVSYNGRICPINTVAMDFVTKLSGESTWEDYSADEIFVGWMIYYTEWETQRLILVENPELQQILGIKGDRASVRDFYTARNEYKLAGKDTLSHLSEATRKAMDEADMKMQLVTMFYNSEMLRIFPLMNDGKMEWHTPGSTELPLGVPTAEFKFINHAMDYLTQYILANDVEGVKKIVKKIRLYQEEKAKEALPSQTIVEMEILHNSIVSSRWLVYLLLFISFFFCVMVLKGKDNKVILSLHTIFLVAQFLLLTVVLGMRWHIGDHVPMSNDYETIMVMAWLILLIALVTMTKLPVLKALAPVLSSLCMLCSFYTVSGPQITLLMPVLQTPLLFVHVVFVILSYSLFAIITVVSACALVLYHRKNRERIAGMTRLTHILLWPAAIALALGILIGSIWAKMAWGTYWSWDPKETWALITLIIYTIPLYRPFKVRLPLQYHIYLFLAFLVVVMTYFGVNYLLPGMHSYA